MFLLYFKTTIMKKIKILKNLTAEETLIGEGAVLHIEKATAPLIGFLRKKYSEDPKCLEGDVGFLFRFDGEPIEENSEELLENYRRLWCVIKPPTETAEEKSDNTEKISSFV